MAEKEFQLALERLGSASIELGKNIIAAILIYIIGAYLIKLINKVVKKTLSRKKVDDGVLNFTTSVVNIGLKILLIIAVVSALGVETTSLAALLASAGVAIGMALSGNLQNFAGGIVLLVLKPFKVGDFVETQGFTGVVKSIQIFHTVITTPDNKAIFVPNGGLSSNVLVNFSHQDKRRVEWIVGVEYGQDFEKAKQVCEQIIASDSRILADPESFVGLHALADSSVNIRIWAWVPSSEYWDVYYDINKNIYETFNKEGIGFPFPQLTVHTAKD